MLYIFIYKVFAWIEAYKGWTWRSGSGPGWGRGRRSKCVIYCHNLPLHIVRHALSSIVSYHTLCYSANSFYFCLFCSKNSDVIVFIKSNKKCKGSLQKKTVKRVTSSLKVGRLETKNHIIFEKKNSDMKGRCKNQFWYKTIGFIEKCLNEVILWILYVYWSIWYIFQLDFGRNRFFSEYKLGILCHYFLGVGR